MRGDTSGRTVRFQLAGKYCRLNDPLAQQCLHQNDGANSLAEVENEHLHQSLIKRHISVGSD